MQETFNMQETANWSIVPNLDVEKIVHTIPSLKMAYLVNQKACSRSIRMVFGSPSAFSWKYKNLWGPRPTWRTRFPIDCRDWFKFTFVRNPWDRLVSLWEFFRMPHIRRTNFPQITMKALKVGLGVPWNDFVDRVCSVPDEKIPFVARSQFTMFPAWFDKPVDFLGKFETFVQDWELLQRLKPGVPSLLVKPKTPMHANKSNRKPYPEYYNKHRRDLVAKRYAIDIELFEYEFEDSDVQEN